MAGLPRKTQKVFASSLTPADNIAVWGSTAAGSPTYSNDLAAIQSAAWLLGLNGAVVGNKSPTIQDLNALFLEITQQLAYILSRGLPDWDSGTTYNTDDFCKVGATIYYSNADGNTNNAPGSTSQWTNLLEATSSANLAKAWVEFSGTATDGHGNCVVFNAFNVSRVVKLATGAYQIIFATPLPSANYTFVGSAGTQDGQPPGPGDNNLIMGGTPGYTGVRNADACNVFCREPTQSPGLEDSTCISVQFFGT